MQLTVAIPVYNAEKTVAESIRSVLSQTYQDFELILTDDGSTDRSLDIIKSFEDSRIKIICDGQHKGLAVRLNEQIAAARGRFFARMDADDVMLPERLERQMEFFHRHPETDVLGSAAIIIDEQGNRIGYRGSGVWKRGAERKKGMLDYLPVRSFMHPTVVGRTEWFRSYYYNPACEGCEDQDLWLRGCHNSHFYSLYEPLLLYRDVQQLDVKTYLFRQNKGIYVQKLNSASSNWWTCQLAMAKCHFKSFVAVMLSFLGLSRLILRARNNNYSALNNHVLHVITSLRTGGAEKLMVDLLPLLREKGNDVELAVFDGINTPFYEALQQTGIKIHYFTKNKSVYDPFHIIRLGRLMRNADVVHTHNTSPQLFAAIANIFVGAKLITTEHNTSNRRRNKSWLKPFDQWMYRQYEKIICISDQAEENLKQYLPAFQGIICTIYNGIDLSKYSNLYLTERHDRSSVVVTMVAAFREQKDQKTLIKAMVFLPAIYRLQLVGTGDPSLITESEELAKTMGVADRVDFMGMRSDIPQILSSSDVVVLSSHYEGLSLSSLEGMASGRPFIATDVDGLHEIVNGYGILVPHEDPKALADAILWVTTDKKRGQTVASRCLERAKMFGIDQMARQYNALYN